MPSFSLSAPAPSTPRILPIGNRARTRFAPKAVNVRDLAALCEYFVDESERPVDGKVFFSPAGEWPNEDRHPFEGIADRFSRGQAQSLSTLEHLSCAVFDEGSVASGSSRHRRGGESGF